MMTHLFSFRLLQRTVLFLMVCCLPVYAYPQAKICLAGKPGSNDFAFPQEAVGKLMQGRETHSFFYGETHTRYFEPQFKMHLVRFLHAQYGIRDVFMEMGYGPAVVFNRYLETGDTSLIRIRVLYTSPHYMAFWQQLYAYNRQLPPDKRIRIHGIDFEATTAFFHALVLLLPDTAQVPASLAATFRQIRTYADSPLISAEAFAARTEALKSVFRKHEAELSKLYGDRYGTVRKILDNNIRMNDPERDKKMHRHLMTELKEQGIARFAGFFGGDHVNYAYKSSLVGRMAREAAYKGKISTIRAICFDAFDNWSKQTMKCVGVYDEKEGDVLYRRYRESGCRALLAPAAGLHDDILKQSADFYVLAKDQAE